MGGTWWTKTILAGSLAAGALLVISAAGSRFELWPFTVGFLVAAAGIALALAGTALGIRRMIVALRRPQAVELLSLDLALAVCAVVLGAFALQFVRVFTVPPIHQVTTDIADPPAFDAIADLRPEGSNPHTYDPGQPILEGTLAEAQQGAWPQLTSLHASLAPDPALQRAVDTLEAMGMAIVNVDRTRGLVEATDATFWFGFKDDMVVRVRGTGEGSVIDARSVSRIGVSDVGANARRVLLFLDRFEASARP
ncbi:MAG: DUF1499 domain-containing protein [Gammaproteobacteria bacterium]|nr:DUF1499 domain-containing protein [Gammaproteobacteria bacterium]